MQTQLVKKTTIIDSGDFNLSAARYLEKVEINSSFDLIKMSDLDIEYFKGINVKNKNPENGKFRLIPSGANFPDKLIKNKCKYFDDISDKALEKKLILNDILFNTGGQGTLGRVGIYNDDSFESFTDGFILTIRNKDNNLNSKYLFWVLQSNEIKNEIIKFTRGATGITSIKTDDILNFEFPLPPLEIQEQIVKEIEGYQQIIDGCRQVVEYYKPVIDIDPSWEMVELEKLSSITSGYSFGSKDFKQQNGIKSIKITNVGLGDFVDELDYLPMHFKEKYSNFLVKENYIVVALTRTIISGGVKVAIVPKSFDDSLLNQRVASIRCDSKVMTNYIFTILQSKNFYSFVENNATAINQPNLSINDLKRYNIPLPPETDLVNVISKIDKERKVIEGNKELIKIYEKKINALINKVWSDN